MQKTVHVESKPKPLQSFTIQLTSLILSKVIFLCYTKLYHLQIPFLTHFYHIFIGIASFWSNFFVLFIFLIINLPHSWACYSFQNRFLLLILLKLNCKSFLHFCVLLCIKVQKHVDEEQSKKCWKTEVHKTKTASKFTPNISFY